MPDVPVIPRFEYVATPDDVVAVATPTRVPPEEILAVTVLAAYPETVLPPESFTAICG